MRHAIDKWAILKRGNGIIGERSIFGFNHRTVETATASSKKTKWKKETKEKSAALERAQCFTCYVCGDCARWHSRATERLCKMHIHEMNMTFKLHPKSSARASLGARTSQPVIMSTARRQRQNSISIVATCSLRRLHNSMRTQRSRRSTCLRINYIAS